MPAKPIEIRISQPGSPAADDDEPTFPRYEGPAFLSYGFRPFFLSAALFAGLAVPVWVLLFAGASGGGFLYPAREWHVHEMLFGFLPAVMTGFLLTAVPNWTGRAPFRGLPLLSLLFLWLAGRLLLAWPWPSPLVAAVIDGSFFVAVAALLWRELAAASTWGQAPIALLISLYAGTNMFFHAMALRGESTALPERLVLAFLMLLLTMIGGRLAPNFTREFLMQARAAPLPPPFSRLDGMGIGLVLLAALVWIVQPESRIAGGLFVAAGVVTVIRLSRWRGWTTWREPLVLILHVGYGWLALSMLALGCALLGMGVQQASAVHVLTTGAVGAMTLAVMTRASLGHTGRAKVAGPVTIMMYLLVNLGALLRVVVPTPDAPTGLTHLLLGLAAVCWSGAYVLFAMSYGPYLLRPSLDE